MFHRLEQQLKVQCRIVLGQPLFPVGVVMNLSIIVHWIYTGKIEYLKINEKTFLFIEKKRLTKKKKHVEHGQQNLILG